LNGGQKADLAGRRTFQGKVVTWRFGRKRVTLMSSVLQTTRKQLTAHLREFKA
jgi:hypothetical protein